MHCKGTHTPSYHQITTNLLSSFYPPLNIAKHAPSPTPPPTDAASYRITGIPTFRGGSDSIWCVTAAAQGRRSVFLRNPLRWYNEFWLRHFPMSFTRMIPNAGHEALAGLARAFPRVRVITQNIDALVSALFGWCGSLRCVSQLCWSEILSVCTDVLICRL